MQSLCKLPAFRLLFNGFVCSKLFQLPSRMEQKQSKRCCIYMLCMHCRGHNTCNCHRNVKHTCIQCTTKGKVHKNMESKGLYIYYTQMNKVPILIFALYYRKVNQRTLFLCNCGHNTKEKKVC